MGKINKITHKELMLLFGYGVYGAKHRITSIRNSLEKQQSQTLTVLEYCKYEGITLDDFDLMLERAYAKK